MFEILDKKLIFVHKKKKHIYTDMEFEKLNLSNIDDHKILYWSIKIMYPKLFKEINDWENVSISDWYCNYSNVDKIKLKLKSSKIEIEKNKMIINYKKKDLEFIYIYILSYINYLRYPMSNLKILIENNNEIEIKIIDNDYVIDYLELFRQLIKNKKCIITTERNLLEYLHPFYYKGIDLIKAD